MPSHEQSVDNSTYAHKMLDAATTDYRNIDLGHSNQLNLVDIMAYEQTGPKQKQVGEFLEHNLDTLRGFSTGESGKGVATLADLKSAYFLTSSNKEAVAKEEKAEAKRKADGVGKFTLGAVGAVATTGALVAGPETLLATVPIGLALSAGTWVRTYNDTVVREKNMETLAWGMKK